MFGNFTTLCMKVFKGDGNFICLMHGGGKESEGNINELRCKIYCQRSGKIGINMLSPCLNVLTQRAQRVNYQSRIWHQCSVPSPSIGAPNGND